MEDPILTNEEFTALLEESAIEAINEFNAIYGTNRTLDEETLFYLTAFAVVSLYGYKVLSARADIPNDTKQQVLDQFPKDYEGINATSREQFRNLAKELSQEELNKQLEDFRARRAQEIADGIYYTTRNELQAQLAQNEGFSFVGAVSVGDSRVRPEHVENNGKFWKASTYQPWHDYNCRCIYSYFRTAEEARKNGFERR